MRTSSGVWNWMVIAPVGLVVLAVLAIIMLDVAKGGAAEPAPPLGEIGTPVRQAYIAPTATPVGQQPDATPRPRPTFAGVGAAQGDPAQRDTQRRNDLLLLLGAAQALKAKDGSYPTTKSNVQTVCAYQDIDIACKLKETFVGNLPSDPLGDPVKNGYWYSSDGSSVTLYAALENDVSADQRCQTNDAELKKHPNVVCVKAS
jgi:hypothetical protein